MDESDVTCSAGLIVPEVLPPVSVRLSVVVGSRNGSYKKGIFVVN